MTLQEYVPSSSSRFMFIMARLYIPVAAFIITDKRSLLLISGFISPLIEYVKYEVVPSHVVVALTDNKTGQTSVRFSPSRPNIVSRHWICATNHQNHLVIYNYTYSEYQSFFLHF